MRVYAKDHACAFRFTRQAWGELSNFHPLAAPIAAGPFRFRTSEALYQAAKFGARPDVQRRIAEAPTPREAAAIGRTPGLGIDPGADHILTEKSTSYGEFSAVIRHFVRKVVPMCPASRSVPYRTPAFTDPSTPEMLSLRPAPIDPGWNAQRVDVMRWVLRMKREANRAGIDAVLAATGERAIVEVSARDPWWGARPVADRYEGRNVLGRLWMELRHQLRENDPAAGAGAWSGRIRVGCLAGAAGRLDPARAAA